MALAAIAAVEGILFCGYAAFLAIETARIGITGPAEVSNPASVTLLILIVALCGAGLLWLARGWWLSRAWARAPFLLAQVIGLLVGYTFAQAEGSERVYGQAAMVVAAAGVVLALLPVTGRQLDRD